MSGEKQFEFRKTSIDPKLTHVVVYASSPIKRILGIADVSSVRVLSPSAVWHTSKHAAGISRKAFRRYYSGKKKAVVIDIEDVTPLRNRLTPKEIDRGFIVPQSFRYVKASFMKRVMLKGTCA